MSTRTLIAIQNKEGGFTASYCHNEGLANLPVLRTYYNSEQKVRKLLDLGDISMLRQLVDVPAGVKHSFEEPAENVTVAYHRDRGEPKNVPYTSFSWTALMIRAEEQGCEYILVFSDKNEWLSHKV